MPRILVFIQAFLCFALFATLAPPSSFALNPDEKPANYVAKHWDVEDGLPNNTIKQLLQTRDGYLWIGTSQGLARFDGLRFTVFNRNNTPEMLSGLITSLAETDDGSLWVGTGVGLLRYYEGRFICYTTSDSMKNQTISAVCTAPDGSLWIGGRSGVVRWSGGKFINDIDMSAYDTTGFRSIAVDRNKSMWVASGNGAMRYKDGAFTSFGAGQGMGISRVERIREDEKGRLIAVTQNGLLRLEGDRFVPFEGNAALSSAQISTSLVDRAGNLWVGSVGGLDRVHGAEAVPYANRYGQKLGVVDAILEDREGCLWAGTSEGLYRLSDRRAHSLAQEDGIGGSLIGSIMEARDGGLWISAWGGGADRFYEGKASHFRSGSPLSHETVTLIYEAPDGTMWFGNRGSSIDRLDGDKVKTFVYKSGVASSRPVTAMLADDDGTLLVGIASRGLLELRDDKLTSVSQAVAVIKGTVFSLFRTRDGRLLMGTEFGIYQRNADRDWKPLALPGLAGPVVARSFLEEQDGVIWIATEGLGLVRWKDGQARAYGTSKGMIDDILYSVLKDDAGAVWVNSGRGIARIRTNEFDEIDRGALDAADSMILGRDDGLISASAPGIGTPAACRLSDGRLMFATNHGAAVIDPSLLQINAEPPAVMIESVLADEKTIAADREISVPAGVGRLEFRYTALSLVAPERLRFRYRLEGSDPLWIEAGADRRATYTHLAPGRYTFRVLACNSDGVWNDAGAVMKVTMLPLFYQTLWFRLAVILVLAAAIASLVWLRLRRIHRRQEALTRANAELDQRVQDRTAELSNSNEELQQRELLFRLIFEHAPVGVSWKRTDLGPNYHFNSTFCRILDLPADALPDFSPVDAMLNPLDAPRQAEMRRSIEAGEIGSYTLEQRYSRPDGEVVWGMLSVAVIRDPNGRVIQDIGILEDVTPRKKTELELAATYRNLVDVSRQAGMAEVATNVLHNVGNVLNSVNISAGLVIDIVKNFKVEAVAKVSGMLRDHEGDLGAFIAGDPRGKQLSPFVAQLSERLLADRQAAVAELASLLVNIEHIKEIVTLQQGYASPGAVKEVVDLLALLEDSLRMNDDSTSRRPVEVVREFEDLPPMHLERNKVLQILVNLVRNAKDACCLSHKPNGSMTVRAAADGDRILISVADNGIGIARENLARVFNHGFTTKKDGHGFGLHGSALAAREMNGSLSVQSDGPGLGAVFTLELPLEAVDCGLRARAGAS